MTPGLTRGIKKGLRTLAQAVAGGALTAIATSVLSGEIRLGQGVMMALWIVIVAFCQNWAEGAGKIPVLLPSPGLIPVTDKVGTVLTPAVGTVEAVADTAGEVTGTVSDIVGDAAGSVTGLIENKEDQPK